MKGEVQLNNTLDFEKLVKLLEERAFKRFRTELEDAHEVDIAAFIEGLNDETKVLLAFRTMPKELAAEVFANLAPETQQMIITAMTDQELAVIVEELAVDDAVDILEDMPANMVKRILKNATHETRGLINQFLNYPESSAGSIMTAEFADLKPGMTVEEAIAHIRRTGADRETIYTCYVIDPRRVLLGTVSVKDLLLARDDQRVSEIMHSSPDIVYVTTGTDQEEVVRLMSRYDLISLPVVDNENRLVGIVTFDDAVDVIERETTEDFEKMAAIVPSEKPYLKTGIIMLAKNRIAWLLVLMLTGMVTGGILGQFQASFAAMPLLVTFIPMLTNTGGNAGSQSSTLVIRGIAISEITFKDIPLVLWKELRVSLIVGIVLGTVNFVRLIITYPGNYLIAATVSITLLFTVVMAKTLGSLLPLLAKSLKADPAVMSAPIVTTLVDAVSLVIYFTIASRLLSL